MPEHNLCGPCFVLGKQERYAVARCWDSQGREYDICDVCLLEAQRAGFEYQLLESDVQGNRVKEK